MFIFVIDEFPSPGIHQIFQWDFIKSSFLRLFPCHFHAYLACSRLLCRMTCCVFSTYHLALLMVRSSLSTHIVHHVKSLEISQTLDTLGNLHAKMRRHTSFKSNVSIGVHLGSHNLGKVDIYIKSSLWT